MKYNIIIILFYFFFSHQENIKNGVYNFISESLYLSYYNSKLSLSNIFDQNSFFRIKKFSESNNETFYNIEEIHKNNKLNILENNKLTFNENNDSFQYWNLIEVNNNLYAIKNYNNCFIIINDINILCETIQFQRATPFKLIRIFNEVEENNDINNYLLNKEPIDILIKYIDLRDPYLNRIGIHQIEKDYDNEELRYSVRSILTNIPWIRKIFILMPNDRVRYFKDYNLIKDKIIYVKDKDLLGYDSSNCNAFLFRYWKMKNFGISDNFIVMDDDYFIGNKLEKSDFFHVENGKVVPNIITNTFLKIELNSINNNCKMYESMAEKSKDEQNDDVFNYSKYLTLSYILKLFNVSFNESIFIPKFTHNAIPVNVMDLKEIYNLTYISKYKFATLDCLYRIYGYLQFQIFVLSYTFIKYERKVKLMDSKFIKINDSILENYNFSLFCINKGPGNYSYLIYYKAKIIMEYIFPIPSPYEIIDNSLKNVSFKLSYTLENIIKALENKKPQIITRKIFLFSGTYYIFIFLLIFIKLYYRYKDYE